MAEEKTVDLEELSEEQTQESASQEDSQADTPDAEKKEKGVLGKKKKPDKKDEKIKELEETVLRRMAEFENFRKRTEKEKSQMYDMGAKSVIEKILPVIDNFERGLGTVADDQKDDPFIQGMEKIYQQMKAELESIGVKPIEAVGHEFDPNLHNAVMQTQSDEYESGIVATELLKGYTYHDTVVRHSMVAVVE